MDTAATDHLLSTTRAVRRRLDLDRPVARAVVLECLQLAQQAPTASNRQNWRFVVVTDADKRAALADIYGRGRKALEASRTQVPEADHQTQRVYESAMYLTEVLHRVPVHVIPCVEGRVEGSHPVMAASLYGSIIPAVWSFMLALRSRGLGSVWTTVHLIREQEAAKLLGIPEDVTQVALIPVAYYTGEGFKPAQRPPVETITYWNGWAEA
jgi:nitroreductase